MKIISVLTFLFLILFSYFLNKEYYKEFKTQEEATVYSSKTLKEYLKIPEAHIFFSAESDELWSVIIYQQQCIKKTEGKLKMKISDEEICMEFQMVLNTKIPIRKIRNNFIGITSSDLFQIKSLLNYQFPQ